MKSKSKREKRIRQLLLVVVGAMLSLCLNGFFIITSFVYFNEFKSFRTEFNATTLNYEERMDYLAQYISELEFKNGELSQIIPPPTTDEPTKPNPPYTSGKIAYLTFDDGPTELTAKILDVLLEYDVKATFFVKGMMIKYNPEILLRTAQEGHTIGNHSLSHKYEELYLSLDALKYEILETNRRIKEITGQEVETFRFPGGSSNTMFTRYAPSITNSAWFNLIHELDMEYYDWNVSSLDASGTYKNADEIYNAVISGAQDKNQITVLMHDVPKNQSTLDALPRIIEKLLEMGYSIEAITSNSRPIQHKIAS